MGKSNTLADLLSKTVGPGNSDTTELKAGYSTLPENKFSDFKQWYHNLKNYPSHEDDYSDFRDILDSRFGISSSHGYSSDYFNPQHVVNWAANQGVTTTAEDAIKMFQTVGLIPDHVKATDKFKDDLTVKAYNNNNTADTTSGFDFGQYGVGNPNLYSGQAGIQHNADLIYQNILDRNMDPSARDYWPEQIKLLGDQGYQNMVDTLLASPEYKDRLAEITKNPNITSQELKRLGSAYVSPFHTYSGSAVAGHTPADKVTQAIANAVTSDTTNNAHANYGDVTNKTVADILGDGATINKTSGGPTGIIGGVDTKVAVDGDGQFTKIHETDPSILGSGAIDVSKVGGTNYEHIVGNTLTNNGEVVGVIKTVKDDGSAEIETGNKSTVTVDKDGVVTTVDGENTTNQGLTLADLDAWWAALDKPWLTNNNQTNDFDQFTKFLTALSGMQGLFGGGGGAYGYGGYGGFNPGGVAQASGADQMINFMNAFKGLKGGTGGQTASTSNLNI